MLSFCARTDVISGFLSGQNAIPLYIEKTETVPLPPKQNSCLKTLYTQQPGSYKEIFTPNTVPSTCAEILPPAFP